MRLSRLHIAGFKSFPDRSELGFDDGVTAIVGPNGCGKSNVVDAITWVLGEQSAKSLRGDRMEDVIFNGSDARKPTGTAEVRLKFTQVAQAAVAETMALDELLDSVPLVTRDVEIGRRLYRSGESEYLIDGEVCRLRDIHDLLMDSGLGVKAYAVIEQGKIGQILSSRPAERRMLIEEAAGVTKYKSRRRAAELKLEAAQQNLTRIDDIVFEVERQRGALKRQAARARRYKALREELRRWEQVQFARRYDALGQEIEAADRRLDDARAREVAAAGRLAQLEAESEAVRLALTEAESQATALRERAHAHELEIGRRQQQIEFDRQQSTDLGSQRGELDAEVAALEGRQGPAAELLAAQREAARQARAALEEGSQRLTAREADYARAQAEVQAVERESDETRAAVLASSTTLSALRQARDHAAAVGDRVAAERERLEIELRELMAEAERAERAVAEAGQALDAARLAQESASASRAAADADLVRRRADRDQRAQELALAERELASKDARLRSLDELESSRATFGDAARFLLNEAGSTLRQYGAAADHLVVEPSYERAVDALLGELLQYVLVDGVGDVSTAFGLLADRNAGRCGFILRDEVIGGDRSAESALVVPPGSRALSSVVKATGPHAAAVGRLISRALIVESFDAAQALARVVSVPVAARTGEVFHGAWLVRGGSRQDVRGILETRAELQALRHDVQARAADVRARQADLAGIEPAIAAAEAAVAALAAEQHRQEKDVVGLAARAAQAAEELTRVSRRRDVVATDRARTEEEQREARQRRDEADAAIAAHEAGQRRAEGTLDSVQARLQAARVAADACLRLVNDSRAERAALVERTASLDAETTRLEEAARELEARIAGRRADGDRIDQRRAELAAAIADGTRQLDLDAAALDEMHRELRRLDEHVLTLRTDYGGHDQGIRAARQALDAVRADVMQSEVGRAKAAADLTHLASACLEAVGLSLDDVVTAVAQLEAEGALSATSRRVSASADDDDVEEGIEEPAAAAPEPAGPVSPERAIADVRARIERLGPVNMMAIEQFDELESRHAFLTTQRQDLLDSIAQTGEAIRKIDKTTRERFAEAFESINRHFEATFTTLFGGGRAGLVQIEQEHDQDSGIDIIAQPPGKRLQNVQLLSGGEKALTAMALMFAVFKHRPSPFCLLEEIDAPLDDAHIGRFVEMLAGMQAHTQFILITHNRKTMEIANRLYGVTMEEPGVSKLISLQLN